ncbi:hypothetical protein P0F20_000384 [Vibrio metschnikovii]|nr:hypothetical protein [Vibrio metschnikovii]EKO3771882.1 hypothetical protein [Vibrio metschnikovii]
MRGIVVARNLSKNYIYILVESDCTMTYFETSYCEDFQLKDFVHGELQTLGGETLYNSTQQFEFHGSTEEIFVTPKPIYLPYYELFNTHPNA